MQDVVNGKEVDEERWADVGEGEISDLCEKQGYSRPIISDLDGLARSLHRSSAKNDTATTVTQLDKEAEDTAGVVSARTLELLRSAEHSVQSLDRVDP